MNYTLFDKVREKIKKNKEIIASGGVIGIPYPFPKMNYELAGIQEGEVHMVTATTGVSKSKYTRYVYIYNVYKHYLQTGYRTKILYFPLEDSEYSIMEHLIVYHLYVVYNISIDIKDLMSKRNFPLPIYVEEKIDESREYFGRLMEVLDIYSEQSTPEEIYNIGITWAARIGVIRKNTDNRIVGYDKVINIHTVLIIDNLSNISAGKHKDEHAAIGNLMREKVRKVLALIFGFTVVVDSQQEQSNDKGQYAGNDGRLIVEKLTPNIAGLATNKEVARDCHIIFGIFSPHRYGIKEWPRLPKDSAIRGYNLEIMGNYFRQIQVIKNNEGNTDFRVPLWFDGKVEYFEELPSYKEEAKINAVYNKIMDLQNVGQKEIFKFN